MAVCKRSGLFGFFLSTFLLLASTLGHAQCTTVGSTTTCTVTQSVSIPGGQAGNAGNGNGTYQTANVYPAQLTISGLTGTIATISVQLRGLNSDTGNQGNGTANLELLLVAPDGTTYMELMGDAGNPGNAEIWNGVTLTIQDGAKAMPYSGDTPCVNSGNATWADQNVPPGSTNVGTYAPTSCPFGNNPQDFPSPGPGTITATGNLAAPVGTATLNSKFANLSPNGTWRLYLVDNDVAQGANTHFDTLAISGWSLILTLNQTETSTTTTLSSNNNPSFTSGTGSSVTLTASVTGSPTPSGGTVTFKDGTSNLTCSGGNPAALSGSQATCITTFATQGNHVLTAVYSGSGSFAGSTSSPVNQFVETTTTGTYCNAGGITMPGGDNTSPYPSVVNVSGISNAVSTVSLTLSGFSWNQSADAVHLLVVSPDNKALEFFSASTDASNGTYVFNDTGAQAPQETSISPGTYQPTVFTIGDVFTPQPPQPAPQVPASFTVAAPAGGSSAGTFESTFNGATANGAWSLFVYDNAGPGANGSITGGWCLDITQAAGLPTTTTVVSSPNPSRTGVSVTVTATVKSGGSPVNAVGSVTFTENGQNIAGGPTSPVAVDANGHASFTTTSLPEGDHKIVATYSDSTSTYALSFGNATQRVDSTTLFSQNANVLSYCNPGTIAIPSPNNPTDLGPASPNPSNIFVAGAPGTINHVSIALNGVKLSVPYFLTSLLVGPLGTTANSLDLFSDVGGPTPMTSPVNVTLDDSAASNLSTGSGGSALATGSFKPTSGKGSDTFSPSASGFYTPPSGPYQYAAPIGSFTLDGLYANENANGTWSLYLYQDNNAAGSTINSWCVNLTENAPVLAISKTHSSNFAQGQTGAQYSVSITNNGPGPTGGVVTVTDNPPVGMTVTGMSGTNWACSGNSCTRGDSLPQGSGFDPITVTVSVDSAAPSTLTNSVTVSGGGTASAATATDPTTIDPAPVLSVAKTHVGTSFTSGQTAEWDIAVSNTATGSITTGTVTVTDPLPTGFTLSSYTGSGWTCTGSSTVTCTSTQGIAGGSSFPTIALTVNVPNVTSSTTVNNTASASGGGSLASASGSDNNVTVNPATVQVTVTTSPSGLSFTVDSTSFTTPQTFSWTVGSSHTIATTSPQPGAAGTQYAWNNWSDGGAISHSVTAPSTTTTYTASFDTQYQLTTAVSPAEGGTVTPASGAFYTSGTSVPLTATANTGYNFSSWTGNVASSTSASTSISMTAPQSVTANFSVNNSNVTITTSPAGLQVSVDGGAAQTAPVSVSWQVGSQHTIATTSPQTPSPGTQETFVSWSDSGAISHTVTASSTTPSYTATFSTSYQLTTAANPTNGGTVSPTSGTYYPANTVVNLTATANTGYNFSSWTGPVASASSASTTVSMSAPESVTANFVVNNSNVTINTSPTGLLVSVDGGTAQTAPVSVSWQVGSQHTIATTSPQTPSPGTQETFVSWSDGGTLSHTVTASATTPSYTATFNTSYQLTTAANPTNGGTVSPISGTYYPANTVVNLAATANTGYNFSSWTGPVASANSTSTTVTMSAPESVTANFAINNSNVTINTSPTGLLVSVDGGAAQTAPVSVSWQVGSQHTIATTSPQTPSPGTRETFVSWSDGGTLSHTVTASAATPSYTATFNTSYQLTTAANPVAGGTVTPVSGSYYAAGTMVNLTATANTGYTFSNWTGPVASASSASTTVTMSAPESVTANFATNNSNVTITTSPAGLLVSVDGGTAQTAPVSASWQVGSQHMIATTSPQTPSSGTRDSFVSWSDGGAISHTVITPSSSTTYTASFTTQYQLTTAVSPSGGGSVSPVTGNFYASGTMVNLLATANPGFAFSNWTGNVANANAASTSITMSAPQSVTANFVATGPPDLAISKTHSGNFTQGQTGATYTITVGNVGYTPTHGMVTITDTLPSGLTQTSIVAPGWSCTFATITCYRSDALAAGHNYPAITLLVNVASNAPSHLTNSAKVSGGGESNTANDTAADPTTINPVVRTFSVSPTSLTFGNVYVGNQLSKNVTVTNNGTSTVQIGNIFLSMGPGTNSDDFRFVTNCGSSLAAGHGCTITVSFRADDVHQHSATLNISDNAAGSPQQVMLTAQGINPRASFNPTNLNFGKESVGSSTTQAATLTNPVPVSSITITGSNRETSRGAPRARGLSRPGAIALSTSRSSRPREAHAPPA